MVMSRVESQVLECRLISNNVCVKVSGSDVNTLLTLFNPKAEMECVLNVDGGSLFVQ